MVLGDLAKASQGVRTGTWSVDVAGEGADLTRRSEGGHCGRVPAKIISTFSVKENVLEETVHLKPEATCKLMSGDRSPSFSTANPGIPQYKDCPFPKGQQGGQMRRWGEGGKRDSYPILGGQPMFRGLTLFQYLGIQWWEASTPSCPVHRAPWVLRQRLVTGHWEMLPVGQTEG